MAMQVAQTWKLCAGRRTLPIDVFTKSEDHKLFHVENGIIYFKSTPEVKVVCIPHTKYRGRALRELVLDQVHRTVGHMAACATDSYARSHFWWPTLGRSVSPA